MMKAIEGVQMSTIIKTKKMKFKKYIVLAGVFLLLAGPNSYGKNSEIKALSFDELQQKLVSDQEAYRKLQFAHAISPLENPMKVRETRKLIARLQTELRSKELAK